MARMANTSLPVFAEFPARHLVTGCGVAIFHVKSERVVVCFHTREKHWFLPKGRRDAGEEARRAAEREGFEESGYRNRILPLPIIHHQPQAAGDGEEVVVNVAESVWTTFLPVSSRTQYVLHWYIAETLPPDLEASIGSPPESRKYQQPPAYPSDLRLIDRIAAEPDSYEPTRYPNTGVDSDEALYTSELLPLEEAVAKLGNNSMAEVVRIGWDRIQARLQAEREEPDEQPGM